MGSSEGNLTPSQLLRERLLALRLRIEDPRLHSSCLQLNLSVCELVLWDLAAQQVVHWDSVETIDHLLPILVSVERRHWIC